MNESKFISTYNEFKRNRPFPPEKINLYHKLVDSLHISAEPEHLVQIKETSHMSDKAFCSCGWKSDGFFDGKDFAWNQWIEHIYKTITEDGIV